MHALFKQFQRLYETFVDFDFTDHQLRLTEAQMNLTAATKDLMRSSQRLSAAALTYDKETDKTLN